KPIFQEYLTSQGTVVKPYSWQRQSPLCAKCPYHIRTGEEARVPYGEFHSLFAFPRRAATLRNKHLLFYELRSSSGRVLQKGHATNCAEQEKHPESMLFEAGAYLDAVAGACGTIGCITLYSNYSPCNEAAHCCVSKIYNFLLKHPKILLCICFSHLYPSEESFPREALWSLWSLWPRVTLQRVSVGTWRYLLCNFGSGSPGSSLHHPTPPLRTVAEGQNPQRINDVRGTKPHFRNFFPQGTWGKPAVRQTLKAFSSPSPASLQPFPPGSLVPQSHLVLFPGRFLPFQRESLPPRPRNIVRYLKMPRE
ncbi:ABEC4 enzyme, partial [Centropus bengalensis]|nr:ABEC4 enzyme [Centropus bengalensis]